MSYLILILFLPLQSVSGGDTVYCIDWLNITRQLTDEYYHRKLPTPDKIVGTNLICARFEKEVGVPINRSENTKNRNPEVAPTGLRLKGIKTFGISIGSKHDFSFDQSTKISINGNLSEGIKVEGVIRDDGLPINPSSNGEGATQELKDIDELYVNIKHGNNEIRFGDFNLNLSKSKFGTVDRKLEGIIAELNPPQADMFLGGAILKGRWVRKRFEGTAGKQGPYELSSQGVVVIGSEKIWLNGIKLQKGKNYVIDYSRATLTFAPQTPIEDEDPIVVEFQEKDESYKRTLIVGETEFNNTYLPIGKIRMSFLKEEDMKDSPLSFALTPDRLQILKEIKNEETAWISGAVQVGEGEGSYIKTDSISCLAADRYEWVGYHNGNYEVSFTKVDEGDYEFNPLSGGYSHVGKGKGDYIPKIKVSLPEKNILFNLGYEKEFNGAKFNFEGAITRFSPNIYLSNPSINEWFGKAFLARFEKKSKRWKLGGDFRNSDANFHFPGTLDTLQVETLASENSSLNRERYEIFGTLLPTSFLETGGKIIKTQNDFQRNIELKLTPTIPRIRQLTDYVRSPNLYLKYSKSKKETATELFSSCKVMMLEPFVRYKITKVRQDFPPDKSGFRVGTGNFTNKEAGLKGNCFGLGIEEKIPISSGQTRKTPRTRISSIYFSKSPVNLSYSHQQLFYENHTSATGLGNLSVSCPNFNLAYNLTSLEHKLFKEEYYKVTPGNGSFSKDSVTQQYYPDSHGDYEKKLIPYGEPSICKSFSFFHSFILHPTPDFSIRFNSLKQGEGERILFWKRTDKAFSDKNRLSLGIQTSLPSLGGQVYASYTKEDNRENKTYTPNGFSDNPSSASGGDGFSQCAQAEEYEILEINSHHNFSARPAPTSEAGRRRTGGLDFYYSMSRIKRWTQNKLTQKEQSAIASIKALYKTKTYNSLSLQIQGEQRLIETSHISYTQEQPFKLYRLSCAPVLSHKFNNKRVEGRVNLTRWWSRSQLSPDIKTIYPPGISMEWGINLTVPSIKRTECSLSYQGNKTPNYPIEHTLNTELRVLF